MRRYQHWLQFDKNVVKNEVCKTWETKKKARVNMEKSESEE